MRWGLVVVLLSLSFLALAQDDSGRTTPAAPAPDAPPAAVKPAPGESPDERAVPDATAAPQPAPAESAREQVQQDAEKIRASSAHRNVVSLNTVVLGRGQFAIEYERAVFSRLSLFVSPQPVVLFTGDEVEWGFLGELGARVFLLGEAPAGLFVAPELLLAYSRQAASGVVTAELKVGYGAMLGLTLVFFERLVLSGGLGVQYLALDNAAGRPLKALPRLAVGFAF